MHGLVADLVTNTGTPPVHSGHMGRRFMPSISAEGVFGALESIRLVIEEAYVVP